MGCRIADLATVVLPPEVSGIYALLLCLAVQLGNRKKAWKAKVVEQGLDSHRPPPLSLALYRET